MTPDMALVFFILAAAVILLVTEWIPMEVTAMLALGTVALTGLIKPTEALSGFSNPAVVTIWAVFILSGGLTRTGVANVIGHLVLKMAGRTEMMLIVVIMLTAGVLSAVMNNVAVAALMLPVVMDIARQTGTPPSRLMLPLAYGSLLGGLTTQIGTPPNILATDFLRDAGLKPFAFFDFTPIGLAVMIVGTAYMALIGRHLLPRQTVAGAPKGKAPVDWQSQYQLEECLFQLRVPKQSALVGKTLRQSRLGSALGLNVIAIVRPHHTVLSPHPSEQIKAGDLLTVEGSIENMQRAKDLRQLAMSIRKWVPLGSYIEAVTIAEIRLKPDAAFIGKTLNAIGFHTRFQTTVLAMKNDTAVKLTGLPDHALHPGDLLLVAGNADKIEKMKDVSEFDRFRYMDRQEIMDDYRLHEHLMLLQVPADTALVGKTLAQSRLGDTLGSRVLVIQRGDSYILLPEPDQALEAGDRLLMEGRPSQFEILKGLDDLRIEPGGKAAIDALGTEDFGLVEAILSPHANLDGVTLRQLNFREKYGLNILAIWRGGKALRANLRDTALRFGDALLLFGPREKLRVLGQERDFIVLTETAQEQPRRKKMKLSLLIMAATLFPVLLGWVPIYIAAVVGAALMVLTRCLTMEEAYRQIEWKAVFLIAGMLPLGLALDRTGAAGFIAAKVVGFVGPYGPNAIMLGLVLLTFLATCFVPTAALVVLMAPIVLSTSESMGLSPYGLMMAVAMAASASFITPISHPANILVMGPGGYRFMDYVKIGGSLTLVTVVVLMMLMPIFWPLVP